MTKYLVAFFTILNLSAQEKVENNSDFPVLKGPYLGQKSPGKTPEIFAPGIISTGANEHCFPAFSPDGKEIFWSIYEQNFQTVYHMKQDSNGVWSKPVTAWFSDEVSAGNVAFNLSGDKIFLSTDADVNGEGELDPDGDIWVMEKVDNGWSEKKSLGSPLNTEFMEFFPYLTRNNTMYLQGSLKQIRKGPIEEIFDSYGIFKSEYVNGTYQNKVPLNNKINSQYRDWHPCVDSEETFLIFSSNRPGGQGSMDLYISFIGSDGDWDTPINIGSDINTKAQERFAALSPDGKFLFFNRGGGEIFWVDAGFIEELRPKN